MHVLANYKQVGAKLGLYIRDGNPTTEQLIALLTDLLAEDKLLPTIREVVAMPEFSPVRELVGSGTGASQRDALLQALGERYLPRVVDAVGELIDGMLDQPLRPSSYGSTGPAVVAMPPQGVMPNDSYVTALEGISEECNQALSQLDQTSVPTPQVGSKQRPLSKSQSDNESTSPPTAPPIAPSAWLALSIVVVAAAVGSLMTAVPSNVANQASEPGPDKDALSSADCDSKLRQVESADVQNAFRIYEESKSQCASDGYRASVAASLNGKTADFQDSGGDDNLALGYYLKTLAVSKPKPGDVVEYNIGATLNSLERYREALPYFDRFLNLNPNDKDGFHQRGTSYSWLENWGMACMDYKKARDLGLKKLAIDGEGEVAIGDWLAKTCS